MIKHFFRTHSLLSLILLPILTLVATNKLTASNYSLTCIEQDTIRPTANCFLAVPAVIMPISGAVNIYAKYFDNGSYDNSTTQDKLKFYFDGDRTKEFMTIRCSDFAAANALDSLVIINIQMWVEDEDGNTDYCTTSLIIRDTFYTCTSFNNNLSHVTGSIRTRKGQPVAANIDVSSNKFIASDFQFNLLPGLYQICPRRDDDPKDGITTADIVRIQRQILGLETFTNSYAFLAADVNQSNSLTAGDVTEIRKLVLGLITKFTKVPSWIFVPKDTTFPDVVFPSVTYFKNYCRQFSVGAISKLNLNFIAIKMGDVSDNATGHNLIKSQQRNQNFALSYSSKELDKTFSRTDFKLNKEFNLAGMQYTLAFNPEEYEFFKIENAGIQVDDEQYSTQDLEKGKIHFAWDRNPFDKSNTSTGTLFSIIWKKKSNNTVQQLLHFDPLGVKALIIDQDLNEIDLTLRNSDQNLLSTINVYQDFGNQSIQITGQISKESYATYTFFDIMGHIVLQKSIALNEGIIHESISTDALPANALYLFRIHSGQILKTIKLVRL